MKHLFIINPAAGSDDADKKRMKLETAVAGLTAEQKENVQFEVYVTKGRLDATEKIEMDSADGEELRVYACGGDGTLNECVNGAVGKPHVAVTHFPCGTGNDFVRLFGDEATRFFVLSELIDGEVRDFDVINCNGRYSVNICSVGLDARIGANVHKYSGRRFIGGSTGYLVSVLENFFKGIISEMTVTAEGFTCGPDINLVCACNGNYYGGGFHPVPQARPDDGLMDCLIVSGVTRPVLTRAIKAYANGRYDKFPKYITHIRTNRLEIEARQPEFINIDGEIECSRSITLELIPKGVKFIVPRNMAYFAD